MSTTTANTATTRPTNSPTPTRDNSLRHCGECGVKGHSTRTCAASAVKSTARLKEILDAHAAGLGDDRGKQSQAPAVRVREVYAQRGPRYRCDGTEYYSEYRFKGVAGAGVAAQA